MARLPEEIMHDLAHYRKIRQIVSEWNADYFAKKSKAEYFDMILATFPIDRDDCEKLAEDKDFVTFMEERGLG